MCRLSLLTSVAASLAAISPAVRADSIDVRVTQVRLTAQDITLAYGERKGGFTVGLRADGVTVEAPKMYIGDGTVAVELVAHPTSGIFLQGDKLRSGDQFKKGSTIQVKPGFKKASDLTAGDVYVTLAGVKFELPSK